MKTCLILNSTMNKENNTLTSLIVNNDDCKRGKHFPLTDIYNEGWMLRLVLSKLQDNEKIRKAFHCDKEIKWFSEAELKSPFLHGKLRETRTHADAVIGSFEFEENTKTGVNLPKNKEDFHCFYAIEAKMYAPLSKSIKADSNYNQAARYLGCLAYIAFSNHLTEFNNIGLIICAPSDHKSIKVDTDNSHEVLNTRISNYYNENKNNNEIVKFYSWWQENKQRFFEKKKIEVLYWEEIVKGDDELSFFYNKCLDYNK